MAEPGLDLTAVEALLAGYIPYDSRPWRDTVVPLLAHVRALRAVLQDDPLGNGLTDVLSRAATSLWGQNSEDDPKELGRILSGRAVRIQERVAAVLAAARDAEDASP